MKRNSFRNIPTGTLFHDGKSKGIGIESETIRWTEYKKLSNSKAVIVKRVGFGNDRGVGGIKTFYPYSVVFTLD